MVLRSLSDMFSNLPGWMYPKQMYFINPPCFLWLRSRSSSDSRWGDRKSTATLFFFQLPKALLQEFTLWLLLGQRQSFLIRGPSLSRPAEPAAHIGAR